MGMGVGESSLFPNGNISYSTFVKLDTSAEGYALQCGAGETPYGVAGPETHNMAVTIGGVDLDDGYAGVAGGPAIKVYGVGSTAIPLRIGGTVTVGDYLKSDASGFGVTTTTNLDKVGAVAKQSGVSGNIILVDVIRLQLSV